MADPQGTDAWYFDNDGQGNKISWYYYKAPGTPGHPEYLYGELDSMYWLLRPDGTEGPYLTVYSKRQNDGQDHSSTYRSRWNWMLPTNSYTPGEWILAYRGNVPDASVLPGVPRVELYYDEPSSVGPRQDSEGVLDEVISTNSRAPAGAVSSAHAVVALDHNNVREYFTFMLSGG